MNDEVALLPPSAKALVEQEKDMRRPPRHRGLTPPPLDGNKPIWSEDFEGWIAAGPGFGLYKWSGDENGG
jgi:hypothetical protein